MKTKIIELIDGIEYPFGLNLPKEVNQLAKENNIVIVFGSSDDIIRFEGAISDEDAAYEGGKFLIIPIGGKFVLQDEEDAEYKTTVQPLKNPKIIALDDDTEGKTNVIEAIWCPEDDKGEVIASWKYETEIPHETFKVMEDDEVYCFGIIFSLDDLKMSNEEA